jgi:hypothetical protein
MACGSGSPQLIAVCDGEVFRIVPGLRANGKLKSGGIRRCAVDAAARDAGGSRRRSRRRESSLTMTQITRPERFARTVPAARARLFGALRRRNAPGPRRNARRWPRPAVPDPYMWGAHSQPHGSRSCSSGPGRTASARQGSRTSARPDA